MCKHILVALDASEHSTRALEQAETLARTFGARMTLVHAYPSTAGVVGSSDYDIVIEKWKRAGREVLDTLRARLEDPTRVVKEELLEGPEGEAVSKAAEAHQADLIVMGSRGRGSVTGLLLGSVSRQVVRQAPCSVLIVRSG